MNAPTPQTASLPKGFEYLKQPFELFIKTYPFVDRNVVLMMPFSTPQADEIFRAARQSIEDHGLVAIRADGNTFSADLWWNVLTHLIGSSYGIAIYEPSMGIPFNPNVSIEAGFMLAMDRPVLLLANRVTGFPPIDFRGRVFRTFDSDKAASDIASAVSDWLERDISYFPYGKKKLIVFVSLGGTCRCVIAKAIMSDRLARQKITSVAVEAAAVADPMQTEISPSAVRALKEAGCDSWVREHRPRKLSPYLQERADLIVVMTDRALARASSRPDKIVADVEIFGHAIANPYPDHGDDASLAKYRSCRITIERAIDSNFEPLLDRANARPKI